MSCPFDYSVIIPVYNSKETLARLYGEIIDVFAELEKTVEIIFIDDNSQDGCFEEIKSIYANDITHVKACRFKKNYGQHASILYGLMIAKGRFIVTIDDDFQISPSEIKGLIKEQKKSGNQIVYGLYDEKRRPFLGLSGINILKKITGKFYKKEFSWSSFRLIESTIVKEIIDNQKPFPLIDEFIFREVPLSFHKVEHQTRMTGKSGYSLLKLVKISLNWIIYYTIIPKKIIRIVLITIFVSMFLLSAAWLIFNVLNISSNNLFLLLLLILISFLLMAGVINLYLTKMDRTKKYIFTPEIEYSMGI